MSSVIKVLFVCLGNICRSPAAEGVFLDLLVRENLTNKIIVDSAGTIGNHTGELPDLRMRESAKQRGIDLKSRARRFDENRDFEEFDYIITMDNSNYGNILELGTANHKQKYLKKVRKMSDYISGFKVEEVPDPYFGKEDGFEFVLDLVTDGSKNLLDEIKRIS